MIAGSITIASALQIGPVIKVGGGNFTIQPSSSGIQFPSVIPQPPPLRVNLGELGRTIARPFEQWAQSMMDPFGYKKKAQEMEDQAVRTFTNFQQWFDAWMTTFGKVGTFLLGLAMGLVVILVRRRPPQEALVTRRTKCAQVKFKSA
jgi:hypothetical protein